MREYLDAGGKIVWTSDIPFYYVGADDGSTTNWGNDGSAGILGLRPRRAVVGTRATPVIITEGRCYLGPDGDVVFEPAGAGRQLGMR